MNDYIVVHKQFDKTKQVEHMVLESPPPYKKKKVKFVYFTLKLLYLVKYLL